MKHVILILGIVALLIAGCGNESATKDGGRPLGSGKATALLPVVIQSSDGMIKIVDPDGQIWPDNPTTINEVIEGEFTIYFAPANPSYTTDEQPMVGIRIDGTNNNQPQLVPIGGTLTVGPYTFRVVDWAESNQGNNN